MVSESTYVVRPRDGGFLMANQLGHKFFSPKIENLFDAVRASPVGLYGTIATDELTAEQSEIFQRHYEAYLRSS
ncbi:hypothetical protein FJZ21_03135 [Candidatus Pacearchaeota archaeon]|nr:hypothetical protein [Candidatus Pacearchaeota archaeon]